MDKIPKLIQKPENLEESLSVDSQDSFKGQETSFLAFNALKLDSIYYLNQNKDISDYIYSKRIIPDSESSFKAESKQIPPELIQIDEYPKKEAPKFFITKLQANRGRKSILLGSKTKRKRKKHSKSAPDNVLTKIQCHFLNFFISFANDVVKCIFGCNKLTFKPINYRCKKRVSYDYFNRLKEMEINKLLLEEISGKYKSDKCINQKIYKKLISLSDWLADFFNMRYLKLFRIYYNKLKPLKKVAIQDKVINLSSKTKSFYYLLKKNKEIKNIIISTAKDAYFNGQEDYTNKFLVKKIDDNKKEN